MNFFEAKTIHFTGIKGVGMAALAGIALDLKKTVSGSDTAEIFPTDAWLKTTKAQIKIGFDPKHLPKNCNLVVYTGAHQGAANPEVVAAKKQGLTTLNYARALAEVTAGKTLIATAGVGGKSTTAAMIAAVLETAGVKPSWAIGAGVKAPLDQSGRYRKNSRFFVAETDEFVADLADDLTPKFHYLKPSVSVITNLEHDHPDIYPHLNDVFASFRAFVNRSGDGVVVANLDNPNIRFWLKAVTVPTLSYGFSPLSDWQIVSRHQAAQKQFFSLRYKGMVYPDLVLNLPGRYNLLNAAASFAAAHYLGVEPKKIAAGLKAFSGTRRRFELIADARGVRLYDDYAHHPLEIRAVLAAAREWLPGRRLIAIFQSHTYSRTKALLPQFVDSLLGADEVIINDIFASARESEDLGISGQILAQRIRQKKLHCYFAAGRAATLSRLRQLIRRGDAVFTLGAGNNWLWHKEIIKLMRQL